MAKSYLDSNGLLYFWQKIKNTFVPATRKVNNKALSADITLTASDVGALSDSTSIPTKTSDITNDSGFITIADVPEGAAASTTSPKMDGTATVGTEKAFARGDHIHPSDTSRVPTTRTINTKPLSADVTLGASDVGAAPTNHASTATTYGQGTSSNYGHVKLSDSTSATTAAASGGTAATPKAVKDALDAAKAYADGLDTGVSDVTLDGTSVVSGGTAVLTTPIAQDIDIDDAITYRIIESDNVQQALVDLDGGYSTLADDKVDNVKVDGTSVVTNGIALIDLTGKVDKETGKGLSTNDYTATDKGKVDKLVFNGNEIDSSILPSYVDDVIEAYPRSGATELSSTWLSTTSGGSALTPETGKIYVLMTDSTSYAANTQFRWSGTAYVKLADGGVSEITNAEIDIIVAS